MNATKPKVHCDSINPDVVREAVSRSTDDICHTIAIESQTIQNQIEDLSAEVSYLQRDVAGAPNGPGGGFFSFEDIATMLKGLQKIFEPRLKAKAFAIFDEASASIQSRGITELHQFNGAPLLDALLLEEVWRQLGILPPAREQFFEEWKKQKAEQFKVSAK